MSIFNQGDIVYWCENKGAGQFEVQFGMVDEEFCDKVCIDYLVPYERRRINGIPIKDFKDEKYHKLPKGWTYNTKLYNLTWDEAPEEMKHLLITNPADVKLGIEKGYLVKSKDVFDGEIQTEITKEGFRIHLTHPLWYHKTHYVGVERHRLRKTWEEAKADVDKEIAELQRQASLTDEEFVIEEIDKNLIKYCNFFGVPVGSEKHMKMREYMLGLDRIEDIETRVSSPGFEWKYYNRKKWITINV